MNRLWPLTCIFLVSCVASTPPVVQSPMPDDIGWSAPVVESPEPSLPIMERRERKASPYEKVLAFEEGHADKVDVAVNYPLDVMLQTGEKVDQIVSGDRRPFDPGDETPPWEVKEGVSRVPMRPHLIVTVTKPGLSMGIVVTTNRREYLLDVRSVASTKVRTVRWDYGPEPVKDDTKPRLLPDPSQPQQYHTGYTIDTSDPRPVWTPRHTVDDGRKTYLLFPPNLAAMETPMIRLIGSNGYELVNARLVGSVMVIDHLFPVAELRVGNRPTADVVRITRGKPQRIACPGDPACPLWPDVALAGGAIGGQLR
jgi:type IV secretory pathway VirB9-like protein